MGEGWDESPNILLYSNTHLEQALSLNKFHIFICLIALTAISVPAISEDVSAEPVQIKVVADSVQSDLETLQFTAEGNARITYGETVLTADSVTGDMTTGDVVAHGNVTFKSLDRNLTSDAFTYNFKTKNGLANNADATANHVFFHGEQLQANPEGYKIAKSKFTSCDHNPPHYYITARELNIIPGDKMIAKEARIVMLGKTLVTLPSYTVSLDIEKKKSTKLPVFGISENNGPYAGYEFNLSNGSETMGGLDVRLSTKHFFQGGLLYDRIAGKPVFARLTYRQSFFSTTDRFLMVSRLPEVGMRFASSDMQENMLLSRDALDSPRGTFSPLDSMDKSGKLNIISEVGIGRFKEYPTRTNFIRAEARSVAWLNPIPVIDDKTFISPGASVRFSHYGNGDNYSSLGARLAVARKLGNDTYVSLTYTTHAVSGKTPFEFDRVELPTELTGKIGFSVKGYKLAVGARYDPRTDTIFDSDYSISKVFHCVEPKITWKRQFNDLSFDIGIVGF